MISAVGRGTTLDPSAVLIKSRRVRPKRLDEQASARAKVTRRRSKQPRLGGAIRQHEHRADRARSDRIVLPREVETSEVGLKHANRAPSGAPAQLIEHRAARLDPVDPHPARGERDRQAARADTQLEHAAAAGRLRQHRHSGHRREARPIDAVVDRSMPIPIVARFGHTTSLPQPNDCRRRLRVDVSKLFISAPPRRAVEHRAPPERGHRSSGYRLATRSVARGKVASTKY